MNKFSSILPQTSSLRGDVEFCDIFFVYSLYEAGASGYRTLARVYSPRIFRGTLLQRNFVHTLSCSSKFCAHFVHILCTTSRIPFGIREVPHSQRYFLKNEAKSLNKNSATSSIYVLHSIDRMEENFRSLHLMGFR